MYHRTKDAGLNTTKKYIALDIGGSGGRCVVGGFDGKKLVLNEVYRFGNRHVRVLDQVYWDALNLFSGAKDSLRKARQIYGANLNSLGVDTMGVAFALLDRQGHLLSNPLYHRLPQAENILDEAFRRMPREEIFEITGLQLMRLDSLYFLLKMRLANSSALASAETFLMLPDLLNYWLTGRRVCEYTIASTSHLLDVHIKKWSQRLINTMGLPEHIFPEIVEPGHIIEDLHPSLKAEMGFKQFAVVATASHDTAAAIASIPADDDNFALLSSGTWGLLGTVLSHPIVTPKVADNNFANEGGIVGTTRLLHNSINLWLAQECQRIWNKAGEKASWAHLVALAKQAKPFRAFIDPDTPAFKLPADMPAAIQAMCKQTGQRIPQTKGEIMRVIFESLAFSYRVAFEKLADILGKRPKVLYIIGGGSHNELLCQFAANALNTQVVAMPYEATSAGNILIQMIASGDLATINEGHQLVRNSFSSKMYAPVDPLIWETGFSDYLKITKLSL